MSHTIEKLWLDLLEERSEQHFLQVIRSDQLKARTIPYGWFYVRAKKLAIVLREDLKLTEGNTVAILIDNPDDYGVLLFATWIAGLIALPIPNNASLDLQIKLIAKSKAKAFVFPQTHSAKLASLFKKVTSVKHWGVFGGSKGGVNIDGIVKLEDLIQSQTDNFIDNPKIGLATPALKIYHKNLSYNEITFTNFTQSQLIQIGVMAKNLYINSTNEDLVWSSFNWAEFDSIVHNFIAPLFSSARVMLNAEFDMNRFWDHVASENITIAILGQGDLRRIYRKAILRSWRKPENLKIFLRTNETLASDLVESFEEKCGIELIPFYTNSLAGGVITNFPEGEKKEYRDEWLCDFDVPSSGIAIPNLNIEIIDEDDIILATEEVGQIAIKTTVSSIFSKLPDVFAPNAEFTESGFLRTGDEGYTITDDNGNRHLFVLGKISDLIYRYDEHISPGRINNVINAIKEVEYAEVIGFPNRFSNFEVGAVIYPFSASRINEIELRRKLQVLLPWSECPKVIIFGSKTKKGDYPDKNEYLSQFEKYFDISYQNPQK